MLDKVKDKARRIVTFSDVGFCILSVIYFLLGPVNLLILLRYIDFNSYGSLSAVVAAQTFFMSVVCLFGAIPILVAIVLNIIALAKSSILPGAEVRRVRWCSGMILLAFPVAVFVSRLLSLFERTTVLALIEYVVFSFILMLFVIIPVMKTRR